MFITLFHAAIKSRMNFSSPSLQAYTSASALSSELLPKMRSTRVPVHLTSPVLRSRPSKTFCDSDVADQTVPMSSRFTKKSLLSVSGRFVNTPCFEPSQLVFSTRIPRSEERRVGKERRYRRLLKQ